MKPNIKHMIGALALGIAGCGTADAASSPIGIWIDHTGRGAVEITDCNGKLCGHLVWFKDGKHGKEGCNFQIIGNVRPVAGNKWDGGWIIDPDKDPNKKYDVEITPIGDQKLKVMGYAGMKFLSETMTWTRAPEDLQKCSGEVAKPGGEPAPRAVIGDPAKPQTEQKTERDAGKGRTARQPEQETDCKKYFPQTGQMITVRCEKKR
jgi:uncharacterized protein (DUF2147 family)